MSTEPNNKRSYPIVNSPRVNAPVNIQKNFKVGDTVTYINTVIEKGKISANQNDIERDTMYKATINSIVGDSAEIEYNPSQDLIYAAREPTPNMCYDKYDKYDNTQYKVVRVSLTTLSDISVYNDKYSSVCKLARMKELDQKSRANAAAAAPKRSFFNFFRKTSQPKTRKRKSSRKTRKQRRL